MSKVTMTVKQIKDLGLWDRVLDYKGWDPYICNHGRISNDDEVEFDTEFKTAPEERVVKVKMTMYIPIKEGEDKEVALDRLDILAYDGNMAYNIYETEVVDEE